MKQEHVTIMDWITEHWGWLGALIAVIIKLAQDHLRIKNLEVDMEKLKDAELRRIDVLARIETKLDMLIESTSENTKDIKDIRKTN